MGAVHGVQERERERPVGERDEEEELPEERFYVEAPEASLDTVKQNRRPKVEEGRRPVVVEQDVRLLVRVRHATLEDLRAHAHEGADSAVHDAPRTLR